MHSSFLLFLALVVLSILISLAMQEMVFTDETYYVSLGEQLSVERIELILEKRKEWSWLGYLMKLIFYGLKTFLVAICLLTGFFFANKKCSLTKLFNIVIKAEFILLVPSIIVFIWFGLFTQTSYTLSDVKNFAPLSMLNFFDVNEIDVWMKYPLASVNVFELLYIGGLAQGLSSTFGMSYLESIKITLSSYGVGVLLWIVFVVFIIISYTL